MMTVQIHSRRECTTRIRDRKKHGLTNRACLCDVARHEVAVDSPAVRHSRERGEEQQQKHRGRLHPDSSGTGDSREQRGWEDADAGNLKQESHGSEMGMATVKS
jgi:hypothetical protein